MAEDKVYLNKQTVQARPRTIEEVFVPELGNVWVRVAEMSGADKDRFEASLIEIQQVGKRLTQTPSLLNVRAKLAVQCIVDENGQRIYSDDEANVVGAWGAVALDRIVAVARRINGMGEDDQVALQEALKNDQPAALPSD